MMHNDDVERQIGGHDDDDFPTITLDPIECIDTQTEQVILIKAVIIFDDDGNYLIHGTNKEDAATMFKTMAPIWNLDPTSEMAQTIIFDVMLPKITAVVKPRAL